MFCLHTVQAVPHKTYNAGSVYKYFVIVVTLKDVVINYFEFVNALIISMQYSHSTYL